MIIDKLKGLVKESQIKTDDLKEIKFGSENYTLLHYAAKENRTKLCEHLIDKLGASKS